MAVETTQTKRSEAPVEQQNAFKTLLNDHYIIEKLRVLGLKTGIKSEAVYLMEVERGITLALKNLEGCKLLSSPTVHDIRKQHKTIFNTVHAWAGNFRRPGQFIGFGERQVGYEENLFGALPNRVQPEINLLIKQKDWILSRQFFTDGIDIAPAIAIAFFHSRISRIHPFMDGNGRTSRIIMAGQVLEAYNKELVIPELGAYMQALRFGDGGDLGELVKIICPELSDKSLTINTPFQVGPLSREQIATCTNQRDELSVSYTATAKKRK